MPKFDVVVVGAGNAGMSAALQSQLLGFKTLLIEQHNLPGGAATSFVRGRFEVDPSLHELCDYGPADNPGDVRNMMADYGVKAEFLEVGECFRCVSTYRDGSPMDVTMPAGIDAFIDKMEFYVPGSREKMVQLFDLFQEVLDGIAYITASRGNPDKNILGTTYANMLKTGAYSTQEVFDALELPDRCQDILSTYWSYLGVDMEHLAFIHYAAMVHKYTSRGAYILKHTSHELATAMVERFRELGGEIWFNCRAEEFLFRGEYCCGVRTNLGVVDCHYVLANINPDIIYGKMMPKELVPEREKKLVAARDRKIGGRMYTAYFCMDCTPEELGIHDYTIFLPGSCDSPTEYAGIMGGMKTNNFSIFNCYNIAHPEFSPPGTCVCAFTTFGSPVDWNDLKQEDYFKFKEAGVDKMLANLKEKLGVDLSGHIEEIEIASPWTFARYLGVPEGGVYGYEPRDWDGMMARMQMIAYDYPIKGMRPIGAAGPRGDGYAASMICGRLMALNAALDMKKWKEEGGKA
ncbi:MAG: NAD(P)/FAD-dependent oxidoreductase [Oscillospiraceae bacterium]|nr:NAD(P)/FAD-dependent oxidoreductase [Oscillospiraceae bacterium]